MNSTPKDLKKENRALRKEIKTLRAAVCIDPLTQVFNRRMFNELMNTAYLEVVGEKKYPRRRRQSSRFSLLLADVDDFKSINDRFGHLYGDRVLKRVAKLLKDSVREVDAVARWGGEEFIIVLYGATRSQATRRAELIAARARERLPVTLSIGVVQSDPKHSVAALFKKVDAALYRAKRLGKDRVIVV